MFERIHMINCFNISIIVGSSTLVKGLVIQPKYNIIEEFFLMKKWFPLFLNNKHRRESTLSTESNFDWHGKSGFLTHSSNGI